MLTRHPKLNINLTTVGGVTLLVWTHADLQPQAEHQPHDQWEGSHCLCGPTLTRHPKLNINLTTVGGVTLLVRTHANSQPQAEHQPHDSGRSHTACEDPR